MIRRVLVKLEETKHPGQSVNAKMFVDDDTSELSYNVKLMIEAGLVKGDVVVFGGRYIGFTLSEIKWKGHELLDAIRDENVWERTKKRFAEKSMDMTFDAVMKVAGDIIIGFLAGS